MVLGNLGEDAVSYGFAVDRIELPITRIFEGRWM